MMYPITAFLIGILIMIVFGGVWGVTIISGIMKRRLIEAEGHAGGEALENLQADYEQLEGRVSQLEEELAFLRALETPPSRPELPGGKSAEGENGE